MSQKSLANLLKAAVIVAGILGIILYCIVFPLEGSSLAEKAGNGCFWPWMIFLWISAVPCYVVLAKFWRICVSIGQDHSFCHENAERLKDISLLVLGDTIYFFVGNVIFLLLNLSHPSIFLASLVVEFVGFAVCIAAAALSRLVGRAADMQDENDLTI